MSANLIVKTFVVDIEGQPVTLRRLSLSGEAALERELGRRCKKAWGPGGFAANARPMLDYLRENKMAVELRMAMEKLTELQASNAPPTWDAIQDYRQTADGVAFEVWFRRDPGAHPTLTEDAVRAVVTEANAWEVSAQMQAGLSDDGKSGPAAAGA